MSTCLKTLAKSLFYHTKRIREPGMDVLSNDELLSRIFLLAHEPEPDPWWSSLSGSVQSPPSSNISSPNDHGFLSSPQPHRVDPTTLSHVCTQWRLVAHSTPALWTSLHIDIQKIPPAENGTSVLDLLNGWLARSDDLPRGTAGDVFLGLGGSTKLPLNLTIRTPATGEWSLMQKRVLARLVEEGPRWRSIDICFNYLAALTVDSDRPGSIAPGVFNPLLKQDGLALLQHATVHSTIPYQDPLPDALKHPSAPVNVLWRAIGAAPALRGVCVGADAQWRLREGMWGRLKRMDVLMSGAQIGGVLLGCWGLEELRFTQAEVPAPARGSLRARVRPLPIGLPCLRSFAVTFLGEAPECGLLDRLFLPVLESFSICVNVPAPSESYLRAVTDAVLGLLKRSKSFVHTLGFTCAGSEGVEDHLLLILESEWVEKVRGLYVRGEVGDAFVGCLMREEALPMLERLALVGSRVREAGALGAMLLFRWRGASWGRKEDGSYVYKSGTASLGEVYIEDRWGHLEDVLLGLRKLGNAGEGGMKVSFAYWDEERGEMCRC